ncbi:uncharacterized protein B0H18DRAFT_370544 [Fomitopsis serialis]|uniref:uncharacterized protein n=1 Tax=Fomitopsis serialis TaxID=139415 RepID=UPI002007EAC0|nr:uncharacterized protein B0H18DRAFT_370544 [Neoantrodia serialis]KAH9925830.1 hypothetical protein B0H18DRAFT_370544 [Neoantrodia serialis]
MVAFRFTAQCGTYARYWYVKALGERYSEARGMRCSRVSAQVDGCLNAGATEAAVSHTSSSTHLTSVALGYGSTEHRPPTAEHGPRPSITSHTTLTICQPRPSTIHLPVTDHHPPVTPEVYTRPARCRSPHPPSTAQERDSPCETRRAVVRSSS